MALLKKKAGKPEADGLALSGRTVAEVLAEYADINDKIKFYQKRKEELATNLKELAQKSGKKDDKGSFYVTVGDKVFGKQRKCSVSLDEEKAMEFFKKRGLLKEVIKTVIDEEKVDLLVRTGEVSPEEIADISRIKESFAFYLGDKPTEEEPQEMPTVQVSERPKKSRLKRR